MFDNLRHKLDFDDLLFSNRNRDYGAYQLRKRYNSVVTAGIIFSSLLVSSLVLFPFIFRENDERILRGGGNYVQVSMDVLQAPEEQIYVPPAPPPPKGYVPEEIVKYAPPVVVDTVLKSDVTLPSYDEALKLDSNADSKSVYSGSGDDMSLGQDGSETDEPLFIVEVMPTFRGGDITKFRDWVGARTNYPQAAYENKIRGTVVLTFVVERDGSVSNISVIKGVHPLLDDAAVKAISESPKWTPGLQRGQAVRVRFQIPLNFMF